MSNQEQNESIIVQIVVDDGNAEKDGAEFGSRIQKGLKKYLGSFKVIDTENIADEGATAISNLAGSFGRLGLAAAATAIVGLSVQRAFDFTLQGEQIKAVNAQFDNLAKNAGLVPEELRKGLDLSSDGLANMEALLAKANSAILNLGGSAARLPEVLELSRKVAANLGGTIEERFSGLVGAIESGNGKALKAQGIYLDTDLALKDYAKTLGLAAGDLDQSQKAQAILNAVLDQGAKQYKNVATGIQPATDNLKRFEVVLGNIADKAAVYLAESGPFQRLTDVLADIARAENNVRNGSTTELAGLVAERMKFQAKVDELKGLMAKQGQDERTSPLGYDLQIYQRMLTETQQKIAAFGGAVTVQTSELVAASKREAEEAKKAAAEESKKSAAKISAQQRSLVLSREIALQDVRNQANLARLNSQLAATAVERNTYERNLAQQALFQEKEILLKEQHETKLAELDALKKAGSIQTEQEYQAKKLQLMNGYALGVAEIRNQQSMLSQTLTDSISDGTFLVESMFGDMSDEARSYQLTVEQAAKGVNNALKSIAKESVNALGNGVGRGFAAFGESLVNGGNSLDAFTNAFLKSVGDMAVASGTRFIMEGIAWMFVPGMQGMGTAMMAAGATLATFGGALGAVMANSAPNRGGSDSGGGLDSSETGTTSVVNPENQKRPDAQQSINVTIMGNVLDNRETGMYIVDILRDQYDMRGVKIGGA